MADQKKKRGRAAVAPELRKNHAVPVMLDGFRKSKLNMLVADTNQRLADEGLAASVSDSTFLIGLLDKEWRAFEAKHGKINVIPEIKTPSQADATGTDDE